MNTQRKSDKQANSHFRAERYFQTGGQWFFNTREGTIEGPFTTRESAEDYFKVYVQTVNFAVAGLALQPVAGAKEDARRILHFDPYNGRFARFGTAA